MNNINKGSKTTKITGTTTITATYLEVQKQIKQIIFIDYTIEPIIDNLIK